MQIKVRFTFCVLLLLGTLLHAQDTVMSQSAYDSIIRAIKNKNTVPHDTNKVMSKGIPGNDLIAPPTQPDTVKLHRVGDSVIMQVQKLLGIDSMKIANAMDSLIREAQKEHRQDSLLEAARFRRVSDSLFNKIVKDSLQRPKGPKHPMTGYLAGFIGESYPQGSFKAYAYPTNGGVFSFAAAFPGIVSHFGVIFKFDYGFNGVDKVRYTDSLKSQINAPNVSYSPNFTPDNYTYYTFLMGIYYTYPISRKFSIDARILIGAMSATIPFINVNAYDYISGNTLSVTNYATSGVAFAYNEGLSLRYMPIPRLSVMLGIDNESASPFFTLTSSSLAVNEYGGAYQTATQITTVNQPFHTFSVSIGVGYSIVTRGTMHFY